MKSKLEEANKRFEAFDKWQRGEEVTREEFNEVIQVFIASVGMTQKEFGEECSISTSRVTAIVKDAEPTSLMGRICKFMGTEERITYQRKVKEVGK